MTLHEVPIHGTAFAPSFTFGPFRLTAAERRLERAGVEVPLGGRALEILIVLVERAGEVVRKSELMARVWPDVVVDEGSLRFHMVALRKALGEDSSDRYIVNVPGKGYCFVAQVSHRVKAPAVMLPRLLPDRRRTLPPCPVGVVGRTQTIRTLTERLIAHRFVSIVGFGGVGKTTVALCVGHALLTEFDDAVHFVDLAQVGDPELVAVEIAAAVGLVQYSGGPASGLVAFLREKRVLLMLDNCEHVISEAASLAERLIREAPQVHILATSRETLQVEGERVQRLPPLEYPMEDRHLRAAEALRYPAIQLFVERATLSTERFSLDDDNAPIVGEICRNLEGVALAIELAARGVDAHGLQGTAALLDGQFTMPIRGMRTASPRHQTLRATLDWSHALLSEFERVVLRRLAVFVGPFTIEAAQAVVATNGAEATAFVNALSGLVSKSLVIAAPDSKSARYRLLDTTRTYARERLVDAGEADATARRHALHQHEILLRAESEASMLSRSDWLGLYGALLGDVRAALGWSSSAGDAEIAASLAASSGRFLMEMSLLSECYSWSGRAIAALDDQTRGTRREMDVQESFGLATMLTRGNREEVLTSFESALSIAKRLGDVDRMLRLLGQLTLFHVRIGDFPRALAFATQSLPLASDSATVSRKAMANWMLGTTYHLIGDQARAVDYCRAAAQAPPLSRRVNTVAYGVSDRGAALGALARALWLRGLADQATSVANQHLQEAAETGHPVLLCMALMATASVFVWTGNFAVATDAIELLIGRAAEHSLGPYRAIGLGWKGALQIRRGDLETGKALLRECLKSLGADRHKLPNIAFCSHLAEALAMSHEFAPALTMIDEALASAKRNQDSYHGPESLRIKGDILAATPGRNWRDAEACYLDAIEIARGQSALAWELRTMSSLSRLWAAQGKSAEAHEALESVLAKFTEGFDTIDFRTAKQLSAHLADTPFDESRRSLSELHGRSQRDPQGGSGNICAILASSVPS